jgi:hypothetical protein
VVVKGHVQTLVGMAGAFAGGLGGFLGLVVGGYSAGLQNFLGGYPRAVACPRDATNPDGFYTQYSEGIVVRGTAEFQTQVVDRLRTMETTEAGRTRIQQVNDSGNTMTIVEFTGNNSYAEPGSNTASDYANATPAGQPVFDGAGNPLTGSDGNQLVGTGNGGDSTVRFNPNLSLPNSLDPSNPMPNDAVLFHEMGHGHRMMTGNYDGSPLGAGWDTQEEQDVIQNDSPSEADYLEQRGYPYHRTSHGTTWAHN